MFLFSHLRPAFVTTLAIGSGVGLGLAFGAGAVAMSPAAASAIDTAITSVACSSTAGCVIGTNSGTGPGVAGTSSKGTGTSGTSTSSYGIYGTSKSGVGVKAVSSSSSAIYATNDSSTYATINALQTGDGPAFKASAKSGDGLVANSSVDTGVFGTGDLQGGAFEGTANAGVSGTTLGEGAAGVYGYDDTDAGSGSFAVQGESPHNVAGSFLNESGNSSNVLDLTAGTTAKGSYIISAQSADGSKYMRVDDRGNEYLSGELFTTGGCHGCGTATSVASYAPRDSEPTMEDVGTGHLANGVAYVTLDAAFRNVVDDRAEYHVLVTPEGDSNGVFVSERTPHGFLVRENHGGRTSVQFSYRIVAKPFGSVQPRLPMVALSSTAVRSARKPHHALSRR